MIPNLLKCKVIVRLVIFAHKAPFLLLNERATLHTIVLVAQVSRFLVRVDHISLYPASQFVLIVLLDFTAFRTIVLISHR